jgi:capsid protein
MVKVKSKRLAMDPTSSTGSGPYGSGSLEESADLLQERLGRREIELQLQLLDKQEEMLNGVNESITFFGNTTLNTETPGFDGEGPFGTGGFLLQGEGQTSQSSDFAYRDEEGLRRIRSRSRYLATHNEFAIGGLSNIMNYTVGGYGLQWRVQTKPGAERKLTDDEKAEVQRLIDSFQKANKWPEYEREYVRRIIRDGETFTRFFAPEKTDRVTHVRFIEPGLITEPAGGNGKVEFGIESLNGDVETVIRYHKRFGTSDETEAIPAEEVIHSKAFVDRNSKRGLPGFYPVETNLNRAEKLLRNMSAVAAIQAAIAMVRKHDNYSRSSISAFADDQKDFSFNNALTGKTERVQHIGPAEIIDAPKGITYEFPAAKNSAKEFVAILQAELRAVAARFNMPEFMFTQDASNNNFASTLVAEGPAVKSFESWQGYFTAELSSVMHRMLDIEVIKGSLDEEINSLVCFQVTAPKIEIRDRLALAQAHQIEQQAGVLSPQTWAETLGLNYEQEQTNLDDHADRIGADRSPSNPLPLPIEVEVNDD